ncbi:hypothetical protein CR513_24866, partial [Mucuna pruriens]
MKGNREIGGVVSALTRNEELTTGTQALPKKCRDPGIISVPCTIGECTFSDAMLDLGASINVMSTSIYRSIVQPLGVLEDVLIQVNELIFPADFYVLNMEDETSGKESTLILGRPFLMTARTKINVHAGMLSMEFGDTLVQFNIFEAMKHPTEDQFLFGIDLIDELVEKYLQLDGNSEDIENFAGSTDQISYLGSFIEKADHEEVQDLPNSEDNHNDIADLDFEAELSEMLDQVCNLENPECTNRVEVEVAEIKSPFSAHLATIFTAEIKSAREGRVKEKIKVNSAEKSRLKQPKAKIMLAYLVSSPNQAGQTDPKSLTKKSPSPSPPMELKPLPNHLMYAYLDKEQQLPEQEDKLLEILRQHKRAIGWKLSDLPVINPSICMHIILMEEEIKPIR